MDRPECENALLEAFAELEIGTAQVDFITHLHVDYLELVFKIAADYSKVFFNKPDGKIIKDNAFWDSSIAFAARNGFPRNELQKIVREFKKSIFNYARKVNFCYLSEGDKIIG